MTTSPTTTAEPLDCDERELWSPTDLENVLGLSRSTIHTLRSRGELPEPLFFGDLPRWRRREFLDWLDAGAPPADSWKWEPTVVVPLSAFIKMKKQEAVTVQRQLSELLSMLERGESQVRIRAAERTR